MSEIAGVKEIGIFFRIKPLFPEFTCLARENLIMPVGSVFAALRRSAKPPQTVIVFSR